MLSQTFSHLLFFYISQTCLAEAIYFEARGEGLIGKAAVAQVVINRVASSYYADTICGVTKENKHPHKLHLCQFSYECDGKEETIHDDESWNYSFIMAGRILQGDLRIESVGPATMYHVCTGDYKLPDWDWSQLEKYSQIENHCFYVEKRIKNEYRNS